MLIRIIDWFAIVLAVSLVGCAANPFVNSEQQASKTGKEIVGAQAGMQGVVTQPQPNVFTFGNIGSGAYLVINPPTTNLGTFSGIVESQLNQRTSTSWNWSTSTTLNVLGWALAAVAFIVAWVLFSKYTAMGRETDKAVAYWTGRLTDARNRNDKVAEAEAAQQIAHLRK